ncbi:MAG: hypothetical protein DME79_01115 [Verrucomicrobia bacterium]|nr:MAG: hypothetical protein DME79_01115 [Verrucomicrobiota bacterium]PYJ54187.1 MAG: hypothetical protein DME82_12280 [Verrucomicrobiota bacterium]
MAMFRRSRRSTPPLRSRQQEIARQEAELRERLDKLERMVTRGAIPQSKSPTQTAKRSGNVNKADKRFEVSLTLEGGESLETNRSTRRPRSLRKERREGRIIFLILLTALAAAVIWLVSHLHP